MNKGYSQIDKRMQQLGAGKNCIERVEAYIKMWEGRCYSDGIPNELPILLERTNRAPSWRKIAMAILKNDLKLRSLGYTEANYHNSFTIALERNASSQRGAF